jgi:RHS repeat-associated protein
LAVSAEQPPFDADPHTTYRYLGAGSIVGVQHPLVPHPTQGNDPGLELTYGESDDSPDPYAGLDKFGRVVKQSWQRSDDATAVDEFAYAYDASGNRIFRENRHTLASGRDQFFVYDDLDRLIESKEGDLNAARDDIPAASRDYGEQWELSQTGSWGHYYRDSDGNESYEDSGDVNHTREHNKANEIADTDEDNDAIEETYGISWVDPEHDLAGNMTAAPVPGDEENSYDIEYDAWNRPVAVFVDGDSDGQLDPGETWYEQYVYDALGRRVERMVDEDAAEYDYYYNAGWQMVQVDKTPDGNTTHLYKHFVWDLRYIDAPVFRIRYEKDGGDITVDDKLYYCNDANMNVTALVNAADGDVEERYHYDPYGKVMVLDANFTPDGDGLSDFDNCVLFAGYLFDPSTGLYCVRHRYYHPTLGSWTARDPLNQDVAGGGYHDGMNLYQYVRSQPIGRTDAFGLDADDKVTVEEVVEVLENAQEALKTSAEIVEELQDTLDTAEDIGKVITMLTGDEEAAAEA